MIDVPKTEIICMANTESVGAKCPQGATDGATDLWTAGVFRPNLLIAVQGLAERNWEGLALHIGNAVIRMAQFAATGA